MTTIQFLSTIKHDEKLRRSAASAITPTLFQYIHSPVEFEPEAVQAAFYRDIEEAVFQFRNPLDSLVYLRSKGWDHGCSMHQVMENAHRHLQELTEEIFADRCKSLKYVGPVPHPSVVSISGSDHAAVQVDELTTECCFMTVPLVNGRLLRDQDGRLHPSKESWLKIDSVLGPFEDEDGIEEIKQDFSKYWRRTDFWEGPYHREYLIYRMRELGL